MSGGAKKVLQRCVLTRSLPFLKQGSTLSIRSQLQTDLRIRSHWRDDGQLSFRQHKVVVDNVVDNHNLYGHILVSRNEDKMTSLGREDPHVSIQLLDKEGVERLDGSSGDAKMLLSAPPPTLATDDDDDDEEEGNLLTLDVPDKINIDCDLTEGGSIFVDSKIEGDVQLKTIQGNISVQKLRGHNIDLEIAIPDEEKRGDGQGAGKPSFIFVSDVLESQSLRLSVPRSSVDRIRAKRIHAKTMEIVIGSDKNIENAASIPIVDNDKSLFDDDDAGAICDISSLYIIGDASVDVQQSTNQHQRQRQAVRIKSHHGHVHVQATAPQPTEINDLTGDLLALVDLGGVNGSCEVWVSRPKDEKGGSASKSSGSEGTSCHVHFDSIAPDSVSLLHADEGDIHVTVDRKVESDVRLLSPPFGASVDTETLLLEDNDDGSLADEVLHMLQQIEESTALDADDDSVTSDSSNNTESSRIRIATQAFTSGDRIANDQFQHCEFVDGWIENTTSEPDSRFDRKVRGNSGGGKINIDGAQNQALHGFGGEAAEDTFVRPLLAVSSPDKIVLETLSWMGNIARRYGLDDNREDDDLGRQATRRKGLGREIPTD
mmetsp:Transcript_9315/g.23163  ORF Transcript_9315/g.23163 Transcript_9315/m.23163 type:complete len:601 (-) Transcript_9315:76-1878(-)|eukprot:CAMPEP_0116100472 /NCGR_PEP_ID=MMETSP0327-20121206/12307_1 /TAXON_ID=44447 /ORGANISM="Pseudo-nitzschia delicatissima, Strain B596" /LENGTH=600 /DNA_ID=CAMNT_0003592393 /DNA_START=148 /DNA_END=1950 /DNA_ORIENTATION=+